MAELGLLINVFIAFPSDAEKNASICRDAISGFNKKYEDNGNIIYVDYEGNRNTTPIFGKDITAEGQIISETLLKCDLLIAIFNKELGSPVMGFPSGTLCEIYTHLVQGKHALIYVRKMGGSTKRELKDNMALVRQYGMYYSYKNKYDLSMKINADLKGVIKQKGILKRQVDEFRQNGSINNNHTIHPKEHRLTKKQSEALALEALSLIVENYKYPLDSYLVIKNGEVVGLRREVVVNDTISIDLKLDAPNIAISDSVERVGGIR